MKKIISVCAALFLGAAGIAGVALPTTAQAAPKTYANYVTVNDNQSGLMLEPTLVLEPQTADEITAAGKKSVKIKPASIVLTPDKQMNVTLGGETKALGDLFDESVKGKFIPVVRLDQNTVSPFLNWLKETYTISDMMAISDDISVIETLYADREVGALVNTVYDLTGATIGEGRYEEWPHIGAANRAGCNILLYDGSDPNLPVAAEYVEAMSKVVWAAVDTKEEAISAMAAGCYGVLSEDLSLMQEALSVFSESGYARAQYIAAHRGITGYCNEQSKTAIAATANEGATHIELDLQITSDRQILICHNPNSGITANNNARFATEPAERFFQMTLKDYSKKYNDTFPTLQETIELLIDTDVIFIFELKFDAATSLAGDADQLDAIGVMKGIIDSYPEMEGRWFAITFYSLYAERMREVCPEIPVGFLGAATSEKAKENTGYPTGWGGRVDTRASVPNWLKNIGRKYNVSLDEMTFDNEHNTMSQTTNDLSASWLARGYAQNTWTFEDLRHFTIKCNIATTNDAEDCALIVKEIGIPQTLSQADLERGTVTLACTTYNGWKVEKECKIIVVSNENGKAKVLFYLSQNSGDKYDVDFGLYSNLAEVSVS